VNVTRLLCGLLLVFLIVPVVGQEPESTIDEVEEPDLDPDLPPISYEATLEIGRQRVPLPVLDGVAGLLFALEPVVVGLGGDLSVGPLKQSHSFRIGDREVSIGTTSALMTIDKDLHRLSRTPVLSQLGIVVPRDALEQSYGEILGIAFRWLEDDRRLVVERRAPREIPLAIELVDIRGISTVVLEFEEKPDYTLKRRSHSVTIDLGSDRIRPVGSIRRAPRSLVDDIRLTASTIRLQIKEGAEAADPYSLRGSRFGPQGYRLVFDISRTASPAAQNPFAPQNTRRTLVRTIVVDPGHGGTEVGATGPGGSLEKDLTLTLARSLKRKLESRLPVRVVLTRDEDIDLPLETRTALANENKAELFLSIHLNSSLSELTAGAETFFLSMQASDDQAEELAAAENLGPPRSTEDREHVALQLMLWDLAQTQHLESSQQLARLIQDELNGALDLRNRGVRQAPFSVLMGATMPAVLLELGFLSNPSEEERLQDPFYRSDLLDAVVRAVLRYYAQPARDAERLSESHR